jgi:hypothetical protein
MEIIAPIPNKLLSYLSNHLIGSINTITRYYSDGSCEWSWSLEIRRAHIEKHCLKNVDTISKMPMLVALSSHFTPLTQSTLHYLVKGTGYDEF